MQRFYVLLQFERLLRFYYCYVKQQYVEITDIKQ